jgi:hypothetical protein
MRSPLAHPSHPILSKDYLCRLLPSQARVDFLLSHACECEIMVATHTHNEVRAHIPHPLVYNFWDCIQRDKDKIYNVLLDDTLRFDKEEFTMVQETWHEWKSAYSRAALFFLLTAVSSEGMPSRGSLQTQGLTALTYSRLRLFKKPFNLSFLHTPESLFEKIVSIDTDVLVINGGEFRYNLFDYGKPHSQEEYLINHQGLYEQWDDLPLNTFLLYKFDPELLERYTNAEIIMINKYGSRTKWQNECKELIIAKR